MNIQNNTMKKTLQTSESNKEVVSPKTDSSLNESASKIMQNIANFGSTPSYSLRAMKRAEEQGNSSSKKTFATIPYDGYESTNLIIGG